MVTGFDKPLKSPKAHAQPEMCIVIIGSQGNNLVESRRCARVAACIEFRACPKLQDRARWWFDIAEPIEQLQGRISIPARQQGIGPPEPLIGTSARRQRLTHGRIVSPPPPRPRRRPESNLAYPPTNAQNAHVTHTEDLGDEVFMLDSAMGGHDGITATYLIRGSRPCLIETGTARSAPTVIAGLQALGVAPEDLATIVVTHIHLDHAGGVGDLAASYPKAQVVVHERGARHLQDPTRLVNSARQVFGADMDRLFGELQPTPTERLVSVGSDDQVDLGDGRFLEIFHNPGHASHHIALVDSSTGDLYTGDAAGVFVPQTAEVRPATPPPDFDLDLALDSMDKMAARRPTRLLFSHFGPVTDVSEVMAASAAELHYWVETVRKARQVNPDIDHAVALVRERDRARHPNFYANEALEAKFEELSSIQAQVVGIRRWLDKSQPIID